MLLKQSIDADLTSRFSSGFSSVYCLVALDYDQKLHVKDSGKLMESNH